MDLYHIYERITRDGTITWKSQGYNNFREAKIVAKKKQERNTNPDVEYVVSILQPEGVNKSKKGVIK